MNANQELTAAGTDKVTLLDNYLLNAETMTISYLLLLEPQRFLAHFYITAGLKRPTDAPAYETLNGQETWERSNHANFRGHMFGHYLSALAMAYRATDSENRKTKLLAKIKECLNGLKTCQDAYAAANPGRAGYIAPFGDVRLDQIDGLDGGSGTVSGDVFVPWYNLHKVLAGLLAIYNNVTDDDSGVLALEIAKGFGDYFYACRASQYSQTNKLNLLGTEYGGMNDAFYELYRLTGDIHYRINAECFDETVLFYELAGMRDILGGKHANTTIPKLIGALKRYTTLTQNKDFFASLNQKDKEELSIYRQAAENFFAIVLAGHSFITGGNSVSEHFRAADTLAPVINRDDTHETCNEHNMLKLARELFMITHDKKYADYYENAFINAILSSQNPETGGMTYFQPMGTGYNKLFGRDRFWCCNGTGIENFVKLGDSIYFKHEEKIYVNLYFSSKYWYQERNLLLTQKANLPNSEAVLFTVAAIDGKAILAGTALYFRIPGWCAGEPAVKVNGKSRTPNISAGYLVIHDLVNGDEIQLNFPMEVTYEALTDDPHLVAFRYGPVVLSADMGTWDMNATNPNGILVQVAVRDASVQDEIRIKKGDNLTAWKANIAANLVRIEDSPDGKIQFQLKGTNRDDELIFSPHYRRYRERYGIYLTLAGPDAAIAEQ